MWYELIEMKYLECCRAEKLHRRDRQLVELIEFIRHSHPEKFHDYKGHNVDTVLRILRDHPDPPKQPAFMTTKRPIKLQNTTTLNNESVLRNQINKSHVETQHRLSKTSSPSDHFWLEMEEESDNDVMKDVAHGLHYASIALLGFLVVEVCPRWCIQCLRDSFNDSSDLMH